MSCHSEACRLEERIRPHSRQEKGKERANLMNISEVRQLDSFCVGKKGRVREPITVASL